VWSFLVLKRGLFGVWMLKGTTYRDGEKKVVMKWGEMKERGMGVFSIWWFGL